MRRGGPLPIGSLHVRDFAELRQQRQLSELTADAGGYVRFDCGGCPRTGKIRLADLQARFRPDAGLVDILNALAPKDCPKARPDPWGHRPCRFQYRDLARQP